MNSWQHLLHRSKLIVDPKNQDHWKRSVCASMNPPPGLESEKPVENPSSETHDASKPDFKTLRLDMDAQPVNSLVVSPTGIMEHANEVDNDHRSYSRSQAEGNDVCEAEWLHYE